MLIEKKNCPNEMLVLVRLSINSKDFERGSDGRLCFSKKENSSLERIENEENYWDQNVDRESAGARDCESRDEVMKVLQEMNSGEADVPLDIPQKLIATSRETQIHEMAELSENPRWIGYAS